MPSVVKKKDSEADAKMVQEPRFKEKNDLPAVEDFVDEDLELANTYDVFNEIDYKRNDPDDLMDFSLLGENQVKMTIDGTDFK